MANFTLDDVRQRTYKARDAWWTVLLVDPLAARLVRFTANRTRVTPNQLTVGALVLGLAAGACFTVASWPWLLLGALLYHLSFTLDCMDGKIARLKGTGSVFGAWLDYIFDRVRVLACAIALMAGQYAATDNVAYVWTAVAVVFLDMLRYMDALEIYKVRSQMRVTLNAAREEAAELELAARRANGEIVDAAEVGADLRSAEGALGEDPEADMENRVVADDPAMAMMRQGFEQKFPWYARIRNALMAGRIRPHLISGIEFQMGVFIIAPIAAAIVPGAVIPVVVASAVGMLAFELVIIYKFWLASRDYSRSLAKLNDAIEGYRAQLPAEYRETANAGVGSSG
ncbi:MULTISPECIES: CDP-alcohol phosphatidyltransferase family protein [Actinomadura]|uniref:CDP-alcohol phosphatidyltransferase family protein n=1 Tax=Actinomadura litoris TaxID=2678616 RepID=A0A7K1KWJ5_9ACTN|nr:MULTISPECIES: CDP-alcohol phosphatidyltransferase family protein [Actinomadura]MBT2210665.1 CDP-alcohol phosphatidyltransferase family protein [Actinomadura sp. NEAU-AAG7]MUN36568.1 CDP-alcohol phosphatidyltransferase family protein [Actinomadura litoris]